MHVPPQKAFMDNWGIQDKMSYMTYCNRQYPWTNANELQVKAILAKAQELGNERLNVKSWTPLIKYGEVHTLCYCILYASHKYKIYLITAYERMSLNWHYC